MRAVCLWCNQVLVFQPGRGYRHPEGGLYVMFCPACGWKGAPDPSPTQCPQCGAADVRDDHCAQMVFQQDPGVTT
jgi:rubrerythrin